MMTRRFVQTCRLLAAGILLAMAAVSSAAKEVAVIETDGQVQLVNGQVTVTVNKHDGTWDADWGESLDAALRHVRFAVQADGRSLAALGVKTEKAAVSDALGHGAQVRQHWGKEIEVDRRIRLYEGRPAVVVSAEITNHTGRDVTLGDAKLVDLSDTDGGSWRLGEAARPPAAVGYPGGTPACHPAPGGKAADAEQHYGSGGMLAFAQREPPAALVLGFLSAESGSPGVGGKFQSGKGGTSLSAVLDLRKVVLRPGQTLTLGPVWLSAEPSGFVALERYGDAVAALAPQPVHTGAAGVWCSWYPIRMGINEEIVLANAAVAAEHFKALGLDVIQLDHGWQRGDACGDWVPNERFPHGIRWLAGQLRSRYGLQLGLWIAPTQVAVTTQLFREHPEWMKKDARGKPLITGRWYWAPKPEMCKLDAAQPGAGKWIEETFARLKSEGVSYFKIDFISGAPSLGRAMAAVRRGAGADAWTRFIMTPPLLSVGLANGVCVGPDTMDAGTPEWVKYERDNDPLLAASYWANDRLFHREICDMSVGDKADVEQARFKLTMMTLGGSGISFSDDFRELTLPRIRMMQQCLPPDNPLARPLDLFDRETPALWHMHCKNPSGEWDAVGLFNFDDQPHDRTVEWAAIGLPAGAEATVFEFWGESFLGLHKDRVSLCLAPRTTRILLIHRRPARPQPIATNMHVLGGYHEIVRTAWDEKQLVLSGEYRRAAGLEGKAYLYVPDGYRPRPDAPAAKGSVRLTQAGKNLWVQEVRFERPRLEWAIPFERTPPAGSIDKSSPPDTP